MIRSYTELLKRESFEDRYQYLKLDGAVGRSTFGFDRYLNQRFYTSTEWKSVRNHIIIRDDGRDLGVEGYEIHGRLYVHHMNPVTTEDLTRDPSILMDPEFLITTTHRTHNAIHFGDESQLYKHDEPRRPGDTKLW